MTETLAKELNAKAPNPFVVLSKVCLISISLFFAAMLLNWAVKDKFSKIEFLEGSQITAEVRERQLECLARNIYYEAGNEPFEGKVAVAQVTLNRTESGLFPNDVCQVIYQKNKVYEKVICQFSWYCDRAATVKPVHKEVYKESMEVAKKVLLEGFRLPSLEHALYYHADYVNPGWNKPKITKIGRHIFYKQK
jgi:spore germination cell wall hydrolase CwlJ-like protein